MAFGKQTLTYERLLENLGHADFAPVYFFHGNEEFLITEAVDAVTDAALEGADRGFNLDVVHGSDKGAREVISLASTFPLNTERRVVVVREADSLSGGELLASYAENPCQTTSLILIVLKPDFRKRPFNVLKTHSFLLEFRTLYENQIPSWIEHRVLKQNRLIEAGASQLLGECVGASLREIQNELDKLYSFVGERTAITVNDVQTVSGISREFSVFELQRAMGGRDLEKTFSITARMIEAGTSAVLMIVMLTRYYINLRKLLDLRQKGVPLNEQAAALGIKPFFLREYVDALDHYRQDELDNAILELTLADEQLKTTGQNPKRILQFMAASILTGTEVQEPLSLEGV